MLKTINDLATRPRLMSLRGGIGMNSPARDLIETIEDILYSRQVLDQIVVFDGETDQAHRIDEGSGYPQEHQIRCVSSEGGGYIGCSPSAVVSVPHNRHRIGYYECVRRDQDKEAGGLRFVQENRLARFAVTIFIHDGGVLESFFLGSQAELFFGVKNCEFEPAVDHVTNCPSTPKNRSLQRLGPLPLV